jgi:hypothetical protein
MFSSNFLVPLYSILQDTHSIYTKYHIYFVEHIGAKILSFYFAVANLSSAVSTVIPRSSVDSLNSFEVIENISELGQLLQPRNFWEIVC